MISVTILTKNNGATLPAVLDALRAFDEVLLVDTGSTDGTLHLAATYPNVRVVQTEFIGFGKLHNFASEQARNDWILSIDSDEIVTPELSHEIRALQLHTKTVYSVERHNFFNQKRMKCCAGWYPDRVLRLFHRKETKFSDAAVHEKVLTDHVTIVPLQSPLLHYPYRSIDHLLEKMQLYSSLFAKQNTHKSSSLTKALTHGFLAFFKSYILKRGFLGGKEGFIISLYNGHTAYYKYLKLAIRPPE